MFQQFDTDPTDFPGLIDNQHSFGYEQFAAHITLGNGDDTVNGDDFLLWQRNSGSSVQAQEDSNCDGITDGKDLNVWEATFGMSWTADSAAVVPEPITAVLALSGLILAIGRRC